MIWPLETYRSSEQTLYTTCNLGLLKMEKKLTVAHLTLFFECIQPNLSRKFIIDLSLPAHNEVKMICLGMKWRQKIVYHIFQYLFIFSNNISIPPNSVSSSVSDSV